MSEHQESDSTEGKELQAELEAQGYVMEAVVATGNKLSDENYKMTLESITREAKKNDAVVETAWDGKIATILVKYPTNEQMEAKGYIFQIIANSDHPEGRRLLQSTHEKLSKQKGIDMKITRDGMLTTLWTKEKKAE